MAQHQLCSDNPYYFNELTSQAQSPPTSPCSRTQEKQKKKRHFPTFSRLRRSSAETSGDDGGTAKQSIRHAMSRLRSNSVSSSVILANEHFRLHRSDSQEAGGGGGARSPSAISPHPSLNGSRSVTEMRRHSFETLTSIDEVPHGQAPKAPSQQTNKDDHAMASAMDVLFVTARHTEAGMLWVNHLKVCFDKITKQRGRLPFRFLHVKIDEDNATANLVQQCESTKLQIVVICPVFMGLAPQPLASKLRLLLKSDRVLALLLDVPDSKLAQFSEGALPGYNKWKTCAVRDKDTYFVSELLGTATDILGKVLRQQSISGAAGTNGTEQAGTTSTGKRAHDSFVLFPRKVKVGQNKILAILNEPLTKDDWIKIKVEMTDRVIEITNVKRRNPYTIQFNVPEICMEVSMIIKIRLEKNNADIGCRPLKCESRMRELEQILSSKDAPMELICRSLGLATTDRNKLDTMLLKAFQRNIPPNFNLLNFGNDFKLESHREIHPAEYPTLLHFAAKYGLEKLCMQLMECPGGEIACEMRNIYGKNTSEIAETAGHFKIANALKNFSQMNEFSTMYHYFKGVSSCYPNQVVIEPKMFSGGGDKQNITDAEKMLTHHALKQHGKTAGEGGYIDMKSNNSYGNEDDDEVDGHLHAAASIENVNYLNSHEKELQEKDVEGDILKLAGDVSYGDGDLCLGLPEVSCDEVDGKERNKCDIFSHECSDLLESYGSDGQAESEYMLQPSNIPVDRAVAMSEYMIQPSNIPVRELDVKMVRECIRYEATAETDRSFDETYARLSFKRDDPVPEEIDFSKQQQQHPKENAEKTVDDELLEIIADFKNNVFSIQEVEHLVTLWKNRNDVQKSFKDKQEQLQRMREHYEQIQKELKEKLKRPTPFERMKKFFGRTNKSGSSSSSASSASDKAANVGDDGSREVVDEIKFTLGSPAPSVPSSSGAGGVDRPHSTHSLNSGTSDNSEQISGDSASSRQSGSSYPDSHSEGRFSFGAKSLSRSATECENYLIPPSPRPVSIESNGTSTGKVASVHPAACHGTKESHYIMYPSNVPVFSCVEIMNEYMNVPSRGCKAEEEVHARRARGSSSSAGGAASGSSSGELGLHG